mmetsp:Transcript_47425/g.133864  ORF Transcript_47425/g.133864 Transcript_47425/m.133864 type:complete len:216 (+) Transcript_47425:358-1005(+)
MDPPAGRLLPGPAHDRRLPRLPQCRHPGPGQARSHAAPQRRREWLRRPCQGPDRREGGRERENKGRQDGPLHRARPPEEAEQGTREHPHQHDGPAVPEGLREEHAQGSAAVLRAALPGPGLAETGDARVGGGARKGLADDPESERGARVRPLRHHGGGPGGEAEQPRCLPARGLCGGHVRPGVAEGPGGQERRGRGRRRGRVLRRASCPVHRRLL